MVDIYTEGSTQRNTGENTHKHQISGEKSITVHNGLSKGDKVLLIRAQGGQKYVVWEKII